MIAALKSKGVPVFWVGLPAIRGTKSTADASYLNDLYRARAERAGVNYIDVWDGFVDESGKFATQGPDLEGQVRRLRSWDGVYFTTAGARKLAHYVEREIRHAMTNRAVPVALPLGPAGPTPDGKSAARPIAGPVLPLTVTLPGTDELAGGASAQPARVDAIAASVLVKGDPVTAEPGRADDFGWPRGQAAPTAALSAAATAAPEPEVKAVPKADIKAARPEPKADAKAKGRTLEKATETAKTTTAAPEPAPRPESKSRAVTEEKAKAEEKKIAEERKLRPPAPVGQQQKPHRPAFQNPFQSLFR